jgi:hypothetical protein
MAEITAVTLLHKQLKDAHESVEGTMDGVTDEVATFMPPGIANPIAGVYPHLLMTEDFFLHGILLKKEPLMISEWKGKTGASELQPTEWEVAYPKWLREVKLDVKQAREYAKAVYGASEAYVATLTDEDLAREIDLTDMGMEKRTLASFVSSFLIGHARECTGEISVLKGIQGLKGYSW